MTRPQLPPPPSRPIAHGPYPWEGRLLHRWSSRIRWMASRVWQPHRIGMDAEDIASELNEILLVAIRAYGRDNQGAPPSDALVFCILRRRVMYYQRKRGARIRRFVETSYPIVSHLADGEIESELEDPRALRGDDAIGQGELEEVCAGLAYALRRNLSQAAFAVLYLRFVEDRTPSEIAVMAGISEPDGECRHTSARVARAKENATDFLRSLGIATWDQVTDLRVEDFDASEF